MGAPTLPGGHVNVAEWWMVGADPLFVGGPVAGYVGLESCVSGLGEVYDWDQKDQFSRTLLLWAAENGQESVVRLLGGRKDVDADSKDLIFDRTPLLQAAGNRHEAAGRMFVDREEVCPDSKDTDGRTPLS